MTVIDIAITAMPVRKMKRTACVNEERQSLQPIHNAKIHWFIKQLLRYVIITIWTIPMVGQNQPIPGSWQLDSYLPILKGKRVGIVMNHASLVENTLLVDTLLAHGIDVQKIYVPEHGFTGKVPPGVPVTDTSYRDIRVVSVYGKTKEFPPELLEGIDILLFDLQDVGVRVYTYISTLFYAMDACSRTEIPLVVLDRPNPNIDVIDGPVLTDSSLRSFVGVVPVPLSYGMTIGELALMINGENWLPSEKKCQVIVVPVKNYSRSTVYTPPVPPSPNLRTLRAIRLYPVLVLFEGTSWSVGRGTQTPFELICREQPTSAPSCFSRKGKDCCGFSFRSIPMDSLLNWDELPFHWVVQAYLWHKQHIPEKPFFNSYFNKLTGDRKVRELIEKGADGQVIKNLWQHQVQQFKEQSRKYYLYK